MKSTFEKTEFNVNTEEVVKEYKDFYVANMPSNYRVHVSVSTTNGLSVYVSFFRDGEDKDFEVRHSDHANGVGMEILDTAFSYKSNSLSLQPNMIVVSMVKNFYGDNK